MHFCVLDDIKNIIEAVKSGSKEEKKSQEVEEQKVEDEAADPGSAEVGSSQ
jgi:hypothetical protein